MPKGRASAALDKLEAEGPYTFEEVKRVATLCYNTRNREGVSLGDTMDTIYVRFPAYELRRILSYSRDVAFDRAKDPEWGWAMDWMPDDISPDATDDQLEIIADEFADGFANMMHRVDWTLATVPFRIELLRLLRSQRTRDRNERREKSPKRK